MNIRFPKQFITRHIEADFVDDGNHFKGYIYKGMIPITYCRDDGYVYCAIRIDYIMKKYEDYKVVAGVANRFNGVHVEHFSMDQFIEDCETVYQFCINFNSPEAKRSRIQAQIEALETKIHELELEKFKIEIEKQDLVESLEA